VDAYIRWGFPVETVILLASTMAYKKAYGARSYGAKRTGKYGAKRGFKSRKRVPRAGRSQIAAKLARLDRKVALLSQGEKQSHVMYGYPTDIGWHVGAPHSEAERCRYFVVPVSLAIPPQDPKIQPYISDAYRRKRKVTITGFKVSFTITHRYGCRFALVCHEAVTRESVAPVETQDSLVPTNFPVGFKEGKSWRLMTVEEVGLLQERDGPFAVRVSRGPVENGVVPTEYLLDSPDRTMYDCKTVEGPGGPLGKVDFRVAPGKKTTGLKTVNGHIARPAGLEEGVLAKDAVSAYFSLNKVLEFSLEDGNNLVGGSLPIQMTGFVDPLAAAPGAGEQSALAGMIGDFKVTVYYSS
jgi:hypothetical protein